MTAPRCEAAAQIVAVAESYIRDGRTGEALTVLRRLKWTLDPVLRDCDPFRHRRARLTVGAWVEERGER